MVVLGLENFLNQKLLLGPNPRISDSEACSWTRAFECLTNFPASADTAVSKTIYPESHSFRMMFGTNSKVTP